MKGVLCEKKIKYVTQSVKHLLIKIWLCESIKVSQCTRTQATDLIGMYTFICKYDLSVCEAKKHCTQLNVNI